jgi:hypothetical protein
MSQQRKKPTQQNKSLTPSSGGDGPSSPKIDKPDVSDLLKKMKKINPDQAKNYRQRSGE